MSHLLEDTAPDTGHLAGAVTVSPKGHSTVLPRDPLQAGRKHGKRSQ